MKVDILSPSGCCHGVNNAINMAIEAKAKYNLPTFILGMLVHNEIVIDNLSKLGIITIKDKAPLEAINDINEGVIIFTAHGHDESLDKLAKDKGLIVIDTTCAFVKTNHLLIKRSLAIQVVITKSRPQAVDINAATIETASSVLIMG